MTGRKIVVLGLVITLFLYLFLFPPSTGKEIVFNPVWAKDLGQIPAGISNPQHIPGTDESIKQLIHIKSDDLFGYITTTGEIVHLNQILYHAAVSDTRYVNCSNVPSNIVVRNCDGTIDFSIKETGYPIIEKDRLIIISPYGNGLMEYDKDGNRLWHRDFITPITCLDIQPGRMAVGLLNGVVHVIDNSGEPVYSYTHSGSRIRAIYGCVLSSDGTTLSLIAGLDPQRFIVLQYIEEEFRTVFTRNLSSAFRTQVHMAVTPTDTLMFAEGDDSMLLFSIPEKELSIVPVSGSFFSLTTSGCCDLHFLTLRDEDHSSVVAYHCELESIVGSFTVPTGSYVRALEKSLFIGFNRYIARIDIQYR